MTNAEPQGDPFALVRFTQAQEPVYAQAVSELKAGRKRSHWMWFIFPQVAGLGRSAMSQRYAVRNLAEARAYLAHPVLGARLRECAQAVLEVEGRSAAEIFGTPDDVKLRSSMTLFARAQGNGGDGDNSVFARVLEKYFGGAQDGETVRRLGEA